MTENDPSRGENTSPKNDVPPHGGASNAASSTMGASNPAQNAAPFSGGLPRRGGGDQKAGRTEPTFSGPRVTSGPMAGPPRGETPRAGSLYGAAPADARRPLEPGPAPGPARVEAPAPGERDRLASGLYADGPARLSGATPRGPNARGANASSPNERRQNGRNQPGENRPLGSARKAGEASAKQGGWLSAVLGHDPATRKLVGGAAAIVVVLLGTVGVWSLLGTHHEGIPVIGAPAVPLKDRPSDPGGMQIMSDDTGASDVSGKGQVHLAPPPEQPDAQALAREAADAQETKKPVPPAPEAVSPAQETPGATPDATSPAAPSETLPALSSTSSADASSADAQPESPAPRKTKAPEPVRSEPVRPEPRAPESRKPEAHRKAAAEAPVEAHRSEPAHEKPHEKPLPAPVAAPASGGHYAVQLAALDSEAQAKKAWATYQRKSPQLLGGRTPVYSQVTRGGRSFTRLRVGGFPDMKAARLFCARLHADSVGCAPASF